MHHHTDPALHHCIGQCWSCRDTCQSTLFTYCIEKGGHHVEPDHVRLMMDCIEMCQTSADFMTRNSQLHALVCATCAAVCRGLRQILRGDGRRRNEEMRGDLPEMRAKLPGDGRKGRFTARHRA
jgi:hypothetical protein